MLCWWFLITIIVRQWTHFVIQHNMKQYYISKLILNNSEKTLLYIESMCKETTCWNKLSLLFESWNCNFSTFKNFARFETSIFQNWEIISGWAEEQQILTLISFSKDMGQSRVWEMNVVDEYLMVLFAL